MLSGIQVKKMTTPRELYLECLEENLRKTSIPRIGYKISMDSRMKAAQATIKAFSTFMLSRCPKTVMVVTASLIQVLVKIKLCLYQVFLH